MARIFTYDQDPSLNLNDKLLGTNSEDNVTKNFTIQSFLELANNENFIKHFDGIVFKVQDYNVDLDQYGIITTGTGAYTNTDFANIQTIYLSDKNLKNTDVSNYIDVLAGYDVRITNKNDVNNFGIYRVDSITDSGSGTYKILTLTNQDASGQLIKGDEYYVSTLGNNLKNLNSFSVTSLNDITSAGSGAIITDAERTLFNTVSNKINYSDIVDNLETDGVVGEEKPLSANQGYVLKNYIDDINTLLTSDNVDLDTLQEVVDFIEANKSTLDSLTISNIANLQTELDSKVDVVVGKGLSTEDFTTALKTKLQNISDNAEVNVQSDWTEINTDSDAYIQNKPTDITVLTTHSATELSDISSVGSGAIITSAERTKLNNIDAAAAANVQANWNETNTNSDAFILNKPVIAAGTTTLAINGTTNEIQVSGGTQDISANRTWTVGLPNNVTISDSLTVINDVGAATATITNGLTAGSVDAGNILSLDTAYSGTPTQQNAIYYKTENSHDVLNFRYHGHTLKIDTLTEVIPSGITSGGTLSAASTTQFTIAAGTGIINDLNKESGAAEPYPEIQYISWNQATVTVSNLDSGSTAQKNSWIYIDENGDIQQQSTAFTDAQIANKIIIGSVVHSSGTIDFVKTFPITAYGATAQLAEFARMFGPMKKTGHKITANGTNLSIDRAAGTAFAFGRNYTNDPNNPSIVSDTAKTVCAIHRYYSDGSTGHNKDTNAGAGYNFLDPTKYDNGSGTLQTMNTAKFSVQRLYFFPTTPNVVVSYYGKNFYGSIDEAEKTYLIEDFTEADNTYSQAIYLGAVILKGDASDLSDTAQAKFLTAGIFRSLAAVNVGGVAADAVINDLIDVNVSSVADNHILRYDSSSGQWLNEALTTDGITEGSTNLYDQTVSITEGDNITVTGTYPNFTLASAHPTIAGAASDSTNSGTTFIQSLGFDSNGHVTSLATGSLPTDVNTTYTIGIEAGAVNTSVIRLTGNDASTDDITIAGGSNITVTEVGDTITISSSHPNITAASSVGNSGYSYIQGLTIDSNGHVTGVTSTTISTAVVTDGSTSLVTGNDVYDFVVGLGYTTTTGTVDTANSPGALEFARFTDSNTIEGRTASEIKADLDLEIGVDIQAYDADLTTFGGLAKTDGNFIVSNGTTWVVESGNTARTSLGLGTSDNPTFNNLTLSGNLTVSGTTTTVNTETINLADNIILINSNATVGENGGIQVERGSTGTDASLIWDEANDYWKAGLVGSENKILTTADAVLNDLVNVNISSVANDHILRYDSSSAKWLNEALTTDGITEGSTNLYDKTVSIANGGNITVSGTYPNFTIASSHQSISAASDSTNSGSTFIQSLGFDSFGHVTSVATGTLPSDVNTTYTVGVEAGGANTSVIRLTGNDASTDDITISGGSNVTVTEAGDTITIASSHPNITAASSVNNSGYSYIQDITLDSNGHVTGVGSGTIIPAAVTNGSTSLVTGDHVYDFVIGLGYSTTTGTVDTANSPVAGEFAKFTDSNTIEGRTASQLKADLNLEIGTDIQAYDADLATLGGLAKTNGNFIVGNGTSWVAESGNTARTSLGLGTGDSPTFTGLTTTSNLTVQGNLTVNGTTTTINTANLSVSDNQIILNDDLTGTAVDGGILLERGSSGADASILWDESEGTWKVGLVGSENKILTTADEGAGNGIDSDTLDGQHGSYYLNYNNFTNTPSIPAAASNATITLSAGTGLSGGGNFTTNQSSAETITFSLPTVATAGTYGSTSDSTKIDNITIDAQGRVTAITTGATGAGDITGVTLNADSGSAVDNTSDVVLAIVGGTNVTTVASGTTLTINATDTNTTYSADGNYGMALSGTSFRLEDDRRRNSSTTDIYTGNTDDYTFYDASVGIRWFTAADEEMRLTDAGDLHVDGDVIAYSSTVSDERLKDNVITIDGALEKVEALRGVSYTWNDGARKGESEIGVIAQEVEKVIPEIVREKELPFVNNDKYKTVDYEKLTAVLIEAVKELSAEVKELKKQINK